MFQRLLALLKGDTHKTIAALEARVKELEHSAAVDVDEIVKRAVAYIEKGVKRVASRPKKAAKK